MTAKTLMIQGTGSGVGKSILTAAICRYFHKAGFKVAPFKAQNMALNSFVTETGDEMGRAQAFQAEACGIKPDVLMNPILLKPSGDNNSQVILMGKPGESRNAKNYYAHHEKHKGIVLSALKQLREKYDLVIIEGAGSPAEINLKKTDLVNMFIAEESDSPVLIVGDIDRGGVFAWMKGTYDLLTQSEKNRVQGFIINKFRGDVDLLTPGVKQFEDMVKKPVLGIIPYSKNLVVDEEDTLPQWTYSSKPDAKGVLNIVVIWTPRISNFTDLSPLAYDPSITIRYINHPSQMGNPDIIILPGSKNTIDDLIYLSEQGMLKEILKSHGNGSFIMGICGGFQMLGKAIKDPNNLESRNKEAMGLGLFNVETTMASEKLTRQVDLTTLKSKLFAEGLSCQGYEIHMGRTTFNTSYPTLFTSKGEGSMSSGITNQDGTVLGTYLHGFFDNDSFRQSLLCYVREKRKIEMPSQPFDFTQFRQNELDRLSELLTESVNMKKISKIIGV
ncbi:MAG: cobyric acid synthase [Nitrospina sp.]|jgi:adenosylcobyric acid synthase|nr:cobyric acid synthase [Nitrospina sp.]